MLWQTPILALSLASLGQAASIPSVIKRTGGLQAILHDTIAEEYLFYLGNSAYFSPTRDTSSVCSLSCLDSAVPSAVTVVTLSNTTISSADIVSRLESYVAEDDVLTSSFFGTIILTSLSPATVKVDSWSALEALGVKHVVIGDGVSAQLPKTSSMAISYGAGSKCLTPGPFTAISVGESTSLFPVYRLEHDKFRDFLFGTYQDGSKEGNFIQFDHVTTEFGDPWIPIPSKLYSASSSATLAGKRVGVKDLYNIRGLVTAGGSKAYAEIYGVANTTASSVQRLLDLGVVVVGKTKTAQFASGADTNDATIEYQYPWSPRADGWQTCGASSSGSGCAAAAYDWLDFTLGTDTGGSVRVPAAVSGLYGNRPTVDAIGLDHVQPLSRLFDTAGILARDPREWTKYVKSWYAESPLNLTSYPSFPKKMIIPTNYYPWGTASGIAVGEQFIQKMIEHFGMERVELDFNDAMQKAGQNASAVSTAVSNSNRWWQYSHVGKPLIEAWGALYEGRFPPMDPSRRTNFRFSAANLSEQLYTDYESTVQSYRQWFNNEFLPFNEESCSDSIMVYDIGTGGYPAYREASLLKVNVSSSSYPDSHPGEIIPKGNWVPAAGCPDITVPIGQVSYNSSVTLVQEQHPVTLNIVARKGCDFMLLDMVNSMAEAGLLKTVKTGRTPF